MRQPRAGISQPRRRLVVQLLATCAIATAAVAAAWGVASGSTTHDLRGTFAIDVCPGQVSGTCTVNNYPQTWTIASIDLSSGALSGSGSGGGQSFTIAGTASGDSLTLTTTEPTYNAHVTATISADSNSFTGTYTDSNNGAGVVTGTRTSGPPTTTTSTSSSSTTTSTTSTNTTGKNPTATQISCYYDVASSTNNCHASVADAGAHPTTPTGSVTFTGSGNGSFPAGATCTLSLQAAGQNVGCSRIFNAPDGSLPSITATYGGDSRHNGSSGHTQYFGTNPSGATTDTTTPALPGQLPNEVDVSTIAPVSDATVEACVVVGDSSGATAAVQNSIRFGSVGGTAGLSRVRGLIHAENPPPNPPNTVPNVAKVLSDIQLLQMIANTASAAVDGAGSSLAPLSPALSSQANNAMSTATSDYNAVMNSYSTSGGSASGQAAEQAKLAAAQKQIDALSKKLQNAEKKSCPFINVNINVTINNHGLLERSEARAAASRGKLVTLGSRVLRHLPAGRLTIRLKLNHALLKRLAHGRTSTLASVRLVMVLPSKLLTDGDPSISVHYLRLQKGRQHKG